METFLVKDESGLDDVAKKIIALNPGARIFALKGDMGAGKTTLIKYFCKNLQVEDVVASPTFAIVYEYLGRSEPVYHFDFYRIKDELEVINLGYEDYIYSGYYCFLEWPEKIEELLPDEFVYIKIVHGKLPGERIITSEHRQD
jgi:tRNA threonylcarbamoyladenosine biosynthesis protein TsaE